MDETFQAITLYVDADACPVKPEIYRVAERHRVKVFVVSNAFLQVPQDPLIERVVVGSGFDAADDWIAERAGRGVDRDHRRHSARQPLREGRRRGDRPDRKDRSREASIGMALATRNLMEDLRAMGEVTGGPKPFSPKDRSAFLSALDVAINRLKRAGFGASVSLNAAKFSGVRGPICLWRMVPSGPTMKVSGTP